MRLFQCMPESHVHAAFQHGVAVGSATSGLALVWIYSMAVYTRDLRARIPFLLTLLDHSAGMLVLLSWGVATALVGLLLAGGWNWRSVGGAAVVGVAAVALLTSGVIGRFIPVGYESGPQWWAFVLAAAAASIVVVRARRRVTRWAVESEQAA